MLPELGMEGYRLPLGEGRTLLVVALAVIAALWLYVWPGRGRQVGDSKWGAAGLLLMGLRLGAVAAVAWMLAGPILTQATHTAAQRPLVMLLADTSLSMTEQDVRLGNQRLSRWDAIARYWLDPSFLADLEDEAELEAYAFDRDVRPIVPWLAWEIEPTGDATHLYASLREALHRGERGYWVEGDRPDRGIVLLLSDGHDTSGEGPDSAIAMLNARGWRIFAVPVGREVEGPDVAVRAWADASRLLEGQSTQVRAAVSGLGAAGRSVQVNLLHEGRRIAGESVVLDENGRGEARFTIRPEAGRAGEVKLHAYEVAAEPLPGERHTANNRASVFVQVSRERMRVLLLDGLASWDTRFAIHALRGDAQVELTTMHAIGPDRVAVTRYHGGEDGDGGDGGGGDGGGGRTRFEDAAELDAAAFERYDIIVLGRQVERLLDERGLEGLSRFVKDRGGSIILAAGRPFEPDDPSGRAALEQLGHLLPVDWGADAVTQLRLELTPPGRTAPVLDLAEFGDPGVVLSRLPSMRAATRVSDLKAASIVLAEQRPADGEAEAAPMAALAYQQVGADGRVFAILSDGLWQWAFLPPGLDEYRSLYQVFWLRLLRWLALGDDFLPGQDVALSLDRMLVRRGGEVDVQVATRFEVEGFSPELTITTPQGETLSQPLSPMGESGRRHGTRVRAEQEGVYTVGVSAAIGEDDNAEPVTLERRFAVREASEERRDPSADRAAMEHLAQATGGRVLELDEPEALLDELEDVERLSEGDPVIEDAFDQPWLLALALFLFTAEWFARRRLGEV